ncbi:GNAT family N-acetyltransferase [Woodsholea maritima]|uniref:GNAT family N-acetyltransferase n=1 Tax=Woodsholea maritima TaxID=240237 RepID=UPI00037D3C9A|nr:GNAT family N-acetyltransferase [Woodsholea maritima]
MIKLYDPRDEDAVIGIWRRASALAHSFLTPAFMDEAEHLTRTVFLPNSETWIYSQGGVPVGFIAMLDRTIGGLFLDPSWHGQGLGRAMLDHVRGLKPGPLEVEVFEKNTIGRRFYDRQGFVEVGRYHHEMSAQETLQMRLEG